MTDFSCRKLDFISSFLFLYFLLTDFYFPFLLLYGHCYSSFLKYTCYYVQRPFPLITCTHVYTCIDCRITPCDVYSMNILLVNQFYQFSILVCAFDLCMIYIVIFIIKKNVTFVWSHHLK